MEVVVGPIHVSIFVHLLGFFVRSTYASTDLRFQVFLIFLKKRDRLQLDRQVA